jgi:hypothetical protein
MADKKITQLTNITGANLVDADEFVVVDISADETKAITLGELKEAFDSGSGFVRITGDTMTGNLGFGDNDKAIFGAGSDLQIYHDGSHSYIKELGGGNLSIMSDGAGILMEKTDGENIAFFDTVNSNVELFEGGTKRLETTSTGIDVTGTVTADGLTVDGAVVFNEASADVDFRVESNGNANMLFVDGGNNAVGIGTSSPARVFHIQTADNIMGLFESTDADAWLAFKDNSSTSDNAVRVGATGDNLRFYAGSSERMRIDSSGNLLVGKTSSDATVSGCELTPAGRASFTATNDFPLQLRRYSSDGDIIQFRKNSTTVGSMGVISSNNLTINGTASNHTGLQFGTSIIYPMRDSANADGTVDLGATSGRFDDIYATNGTIQTSDRNEKQDIASLTSAEMLVAKRISALFKTFRWRDKVAAKGNDARTHTGIIAQDVQAAFTAEGLDSGDYSLFISSTWWEHDVEVPAVEAVAEVTEDVVIAAVQEELDEEGNVVVEAQEERTEQRVITEAVEAVDAYTRTDTYDTLDEAPEGATSKTRMGIRYPELLSFVAAYNEQRFASIETRLNMTRARDLAAGTFELATGGVLKLETSDTTVTDGSVLGKIEFKAPDEASGTDAILVGAAIEAVAEGTFAADKC